MPESKSHLVQANRAISGQETQFERPNYDDDEDAGLKDGFDWYMSPSDKSKYEEIYSTNKDGRGEIAFSSLEDLYGSLDVPDTDIRSAWNLVNPSASSTIGKDASLAFLHILNNRHEGYRIPRSVPASLRSTFERRGIDYNINQQQSAADRWGVKGDDSTSTGRKTKFGDTYLSRLGVGSKYKPRGTDFSGVEKDGDWEVVKLKRQLKDLEDKIDRSEKEADKRTRGRTENKPALVKRELELLLDYKRKELGDAESGEGKFKEGGSLKGLSDDIQSIREQIDGLEAHLRKREGALDDLKRQIEDERSSR